MWLRSNPELYFFISSDVVCPTTDVDTVDDDTTDSDDTSDEESVNIYEEVLNCEDDTYYGYARQPVFTQPLYHSSAFHQSYFAIPPSHTGVEKKKLSRTTKSNSPPAQNLGQLQQENQKQIDREETSITKVQNLKKSISSKLSFFQSRNAYHF